MRWNISLRSARHIWMRRLPNAKFRGSSRTPHLNLNFNLQHTFQLPTSIFQGNPVQFGLKNTSSLQFSVNQTLFDRDVLLAASTASDVRERVREETSSKRIDVVTSVSKAYYAVLVTREQVALLDDDIARLERNLEDATNQYRAGIVDKTDEERATVSLNNARAERRQNAELLKARYATLKDLMGYPASSPLEAVEDSTQMEQEVSLDTTQALDLRSRIEYQILQTTRNLEEASLHYSQWAFLPTLSAVGNYSLNYLNDRWSALYRQEYPSSFLGLQLSFSIFEGGKRIQEIGQAKLELERTDQDLVALENSVNAEYVQALSAYKSSLTMYRILEGNLKLADDVYRTIRLQYRAGTKTYLDVITAETDLRSAQLNHTDALYEVLSSKLDVEKALGLIH
jgi:outer membrane protein